MLTREGCLARRQRLWNALDEKPDWILISDPQHLTYLANYWPSPFVFRTANARALLALGRDGSAVLFADSMVRAYADEAYVDEIVAPVWYTGRESAPIRAQNWLKHARDWFSSRSGEHFGVELASAPGGLWQTLAADRASIRWIGVETALHRLKRAKDPDELTLMRKSIQAGDAAHAAALREVRPGMTELEVYALVERAATLALGEQAQVYGDFVSGERCMRGGPPSLRKIEKGDLVLLDFSVVARGYRGDFANTFVVGGKPKAEERRLCEACLAALADAERRLVAGRPAAEIDAAVRASFAARGLAETFTSHSGHGVGLGHPDPPYLVPNSEDVLVKGDIVAVEPGQYVPGVAGMRYERNYLITDTGYEELSHLNLAIDAPN